METEKIFVLSILTLNLTSFIINGGESTILKKLNGYQITNIVKSGVTKRESPKTRGKIE